MLKIKMIKAIYLISIFSLFLLSCQNIDQENQGSIINRDAEIALQNLFEIDPDTISIYKNAPATLIIPRITKAGVVLGGAYGEGVLRINEAPVDYYSLASASYGFQIGAQQYSNIIFFMTEEALQKFRVKDGWELGADAEVVFRDKGYSIGVSSKTISKPVYAVVFDQKGLLAGTSLVGAKFSRLIR
ncbi:MAG: twin-arginine translocation pathway signal [Rhodobacteraceae bacterium]|nr:twin-arginine translocation pathway signal [Paracoccaceae bacterium]